MARLSTARFPFAADAIAALDHVIAARSPVSGVLLLAALATSPVACLCGLVGLAVAKVSTELLGLDRAAFRSGPYGYNALLAAAGIARVLSPSPSTVVLACAAALAATLISAGILSLARSMALPVLCVPFIVVFTLATGAAGALGLSFEPAHSIAKPLIVCALEGVGYVVFVPTLLSGALVLAAIFIHSRIAGLLAALALFLSVGVAMLSRAPMDAAIIRVVTLNAVLTAIALGSTWFVPSRASFGLGLAGAMLASMLTLGLWSPLARLGVPVLILPFNITVLTVLLACRQRVADASPKSVDFAPGTPEENLAHYRAKVARFGSTIAFHLPFRGAWSCTQSVDGALTHKDAWRYAFDFEVRGEGGRLYRDGGKTPEDYHCHGLPVLATADGTVARVIDDVPENPIGRVELEKNWGNVVVLYHAPGVYSLVAHLARGSAKVREGQYVRRGDVLGACGSSGRSPKPHLHFQLQSTPVLGSPTLPCTFRDVVTRGQKGEELLLELVPKEGDTLRNVEPDEAIARFFELELGEELTFQVGKSIETVRCEVDAAGSLNLRSRRYEATLYFAKSESAFTCFDAIGDRRSVIHLLRAAIPRAPFDAASGLRYEELAPHALRGGIVRAVLRDIISPFQAEPGLWMRHELIRCGADLTVRGSSVRRDRRGKPCVTTEATFTRGDGLVSIRVEAFGRTMTAIRSESSVFVSKIHTSNRGQEKTNASTPLVGHDIPLELRG